MFAARAGSIWPCAATFFASQVDIWPIEPHRRSLVHATAVCGARTTGPHRRVPERDVCAILTIGVIPTGSAPDQRQRRLPPANGQPAGAVETVTLSIYAEPEGGAPLWQETQTIAIDAQGRYSLLLGATQADGIPAAVFGTGDAKWLGTVFERPAKSKGRASGSPASRMRCARPMPTRSAAGPPPRICSRRAPAARTDAQAAAVEAGGGTADIVLPGTPNFLAKYVNGADVGNSGVFEVPVTGG